MTKEELLQLIINYKYDLEAAMDDAIMSNFDETNYNSFIRIVHKHSAIVDLLYKIGYTERQIELTRGERK